MVLKFGKSSAEMTQPEPVKFEMVDHNRLTGIGNDSI